MATNKIPPQMSDLRRDPVIPITIQQIRRQSAGSQCPNGERLHGVIVSVFMVENFLPQCLQVYHDFSELS
ncbi:MAG: hypothetical protein LUD52_03225 [Opitutae bacterium]|nr:hypothetical protein [Opitutae bacterium]